MFAGKLLLITLMFAAAGIVWQNWPQHSYIVKEIDFSYDYIIGKQQSK